MLFACHGRSLDVWLFSGCSFIFVIIKRISCDDISRIFGLISLSWDILAAEELDCIVLLAIMLNLYKILLRG